MYIIGKKSEKDYYDGVAGTVGIDKTIVYERKTIEMNQDQDKDYPPEFKWGWRVKETLLKIRGFRLKRKSKYDNVDIFIIGFCGKLYLGWRFMTKINDYNEFNQDIIYDSDIAKKELEESSWQFKSIDEHINYINSYDPIDIFRKYNTPIFVYDDHYNRTFIDSHRDKSKFVVNPILKEYEFYKIFDSFSAFQEIQMFLSGVLGSNEKDIIEVDDKYKIPQHGFDKWSFRKEPEKKK
jgi:hypothetical protein